MGFGHFPEKREQAQLEEESEQAKRGQRRAVDDGAQFARGPIASADVKAHNVPLNGDHMSIVYCLVCEHKVDIGAMETEKGGGHGGVEWRNHFGVLSIN